MAHRFHTSYARKTLEARKNRNIKVLKGKLKELGIDNNDNDSGGSKAGQKNEKKSKLQKGSAVRTLSIKLITYPCTTMIFWEKLI
jgi:hypothetical protein